MPGFEVGIAIHTGRVLVNLASNKSDSGSESGNMEEYGGGDNKDIAEERNNGGKSKSMKKDEGVEENCNDELEDSGEADNSEENEGNEENEWWQGAQWWTDE